MIEPLVVREYEEIEPLSEKELQTCKDFVLKNQTDESGAHRQVLEIRNGKVHARNYVGILQIDDVEIEILPKAGLVPGDQDTQKKLFYEMLRYWDRLTFARFSETDIKELHRFNMREVFIHLFLHKVVELIRRGIASDYHEVEGNLPYLKGRLLFQQQINVNVANRARFFVAYDEFNTNRPANRLINSTLNLLRCRQADNQRMLRQARICFDGIPLSSHYQGDWDRHRIDRGMQHYKAVMGWVRLFLFKYGLVTFAGQHLNASLLFPMQEVFEDFVAHHFKQSAGGYQVETQGPSWLWAKQYGGSDTFRMKPDLTLLSGGEPRFILDTKWKHIDPQDKKRGISQGDMYQLFAYGKRYRCKRVALIYPKTEEFRDPSHYRFVDDDLFLLCYPFDLTEPRKSVEEIVQEMERELCS